MTRAAGDRGTPCRAIGTTSQKRYGRPVSGIHVVVCGETQENLTVPLRLDRGESTDDWVSKLIPAHDDEASPCWRFIDRFGDTYFNRLQLPVFMQELDDLVKQASRRQAGSLLEIRALAEFALAMPHRYLRFVGD